jgi:hypothetical protein
MFSLLIIIQWRIMDAIALYLQVCFSDDLSELLWFSKIAFEQIQGYLVMSTVMLGPTPPQNMFLNFVLVCILTKSIFCFPYFNI